MNVPDYMPMDPGELEAYQPKYNYTQYSHDNDVNVIPEESFKRLVTDTFKTITDTLRATYGPYGSSVIIADQNETFTTKDGFNVFEAMGFSHQYKKMVYLAIKKICERVNKNVGDGTTSCILLAEKMFNNIKGLIENSADNKRNILGVLSSIEKDLQNPDVLDEDKSEGRIIPVDKTSFENIMRLASNYDDELTAELMGALMPVFDEDGKLESIRNVIVEAEVDSDHESNVKYTTDFLPGQYRVRVNMDVEFARAMSNPVNIRVAIFDHAFGPSDWNQLNALIDDESLARSAYAETMDRPMLTGNDAVNAEAFRRWHDEYRETEVLVLARSFNRSFMDTEYLAYLKKRALVKQPVKFILGEIKGQWVQNEIKDLAAVLNTKPFGLSSNSPINFYDLPLAKVSVHKGNCLCIHTANKAPVDYIEDLKYEMKKDLSKSIAKRRDYEDRIRALSLTVKDTSITVKAGTSLEVKMISDKIDDCACIIKSAVDNGIVPNMLSYANYRIGRIQNITEDGLTKHVCKGIIDAIHGLFNDVWASKFGEVNDDCEDTCFELYEQSSGKAKSYDIIKDEFVDIKELPTSSQYDLEVVVAAISIVKYLLTSRAFIFDAFLMKPHGDRGIIQAMM